MKRLSTGRGKRLSGWTIIATGVVILVAVVVLREPIGDLYHVWCLSSADVEVRKRAADALAERRSRRGLPRLLERFAMEAEGERGYLARAILRIDPASADSVLQVSARASDRVAVRLLMLGVLKEMGVESAPAVEALVPLIDDQDASIRFLTPYTLKAIGPGARAAVPRLCARLHDPDQDVRVGAAEALAAIQDAARDCFPDIIDAIRDGRLRLRRMIVALALISGVDKEPIRRLIRELSNGEIEADAATREEILALLRKFLGEST